MFVPPVHTSRGAPEGPRRPASRRGRARQPFHALRRVGARPDVEGLFADDVRIGNRIARHGQSHGLIVRPIGNLCVLSLALALLKEDIDQIVDILRASIEVATSDLHATDNERATRSEEARG